MACQNSLAKRVSQVSPNCTKEVFTYLAAVRDLTHCAHMDTWRGVVKECYKHLCTGCGQLPRSKVNPSWSHTYTRLVQSHAVPRAILPGTGPDCMEPFCLIPYLTEATLPGTTFHAQPPCHTLSSNSRTVHRLTADIFSKPSQIPCTSKRQPSGQTAAHTYTRISKQHLIANCPVPHIVAHPICTPAEL